MNGWTLFFCAAALGMLAILWMDRVRRQHERMDVERMRGSMLYYEIYPLVVEARAHDIDHVLIERTRVVFFSVCPPGEIGAFVMSEWGHRPLNPRRTMALAQVIADDLPILTRPVSYLEVSVSSEDGKSHAVSVSVSVSVSGSVSGSAWDFGLMSILYPVNLAARRAF